jgi:hypothetical protein
MSSGAKLGTAGKRFKEIAGRVGREKMAEKQLEQTEDRAIFTFTEALQAALADSGAKKRVPWYILTPNDNFRRIWELILTFLLIYALIFLPIREVFYTDATYGTFDLIVDVLFIADVFITFLSAYEDAWGDLITRPKAIAKHYLSGWFWIDALSSFPFALLPDVPYDRLSVFATLGKSLKIPRLILRTLRMLKLMRAYRFRKFFYELEFSPLVHQGFVRALKLILVIVVIMHFSACIWYKVGDLAHDQGPGSWLSNLDSDTLNGASVGYLYLLSLCKVVLTIELLTKLWRHHWTIAG